MKDLNFKRTLFGYDQDRSHELINRLDHDFKNQMKKLREELAGEAHSLQLLLVEVNRLKNDQDSIKSIEDELYRLLVDSHLNATKKVYLAMQEAEYKEKEVSDRVQSKKAELGNIKLMGEKIREDIGNMAEKLREEIGNLADRYKPEENE